MDTYSQRFLSFEDRFWQKVNKDGPIPTTDPSLGPCWIWISAERGKGYGGFYIGEGRTALAHRIAYQLVKGPIPEGFNLDHLCRTRFCVNPGHLEPVTLRKNILRGAGFAATNAKKTHCPNGHPYDDNNTALYYRHRSCRICHAARERKRRSERK